MNQNSSEAYCKRTISLPIERLIRNQKFDDWLTSLGTQTRYLYDPIKNNRLADFDLPQCDYSNTSHA
jgi:hypothetical protein